MFKIVDGREYFYQWDLDRQVAVEDATITEVHFCNRTDDCSLVVEVVDGLANVPNVILQKSFNVRVFGYDGKATRYDKVFEVKARSKPSDYVYTEVEIKRYDDLNKRIDEIEEKGFSEEVVDNAVQDYFEKNPIDFTGYATEDYVDEAVKNVQVDLTGYATEDYVDKAIENIDIPEPEKVDLTGYAKEQWVKDQGYLTEHQSLEGYATEKYVDDAIAAIEIPESGGDVDLTNYVTTDTEQEITGTKIFTQSVKVTSPTTSARLTDNGLALSSSSNGAVVQLKRQHYDYGINIKLAGTGYTTDENKRLYIHCDDEYNRATLGTASTPWYEMHLKTLSDGKTSKSVTDVLAAPTMSEVSQAIQDALNAIGVAEGGAY